MTKIEGGAGTGRQVFVLHRNDQGGGFVAARGAGQSYVRDPGDARQFSSYGSAERDRCDNETIYQYHAGSLWRATPNASA